MEAIGVTSHSLCSRYSRNCFRLFQPVVLEFLVFYYHIMREDRRLVILRTLWNQPQRALQRLCSRHLLALLYGSGFLFFVNVGKKSMNSKSSSTSILLGQAKMSTSKDAHVTNWTSATPLWLATVMLIGLAWIRGLSHTG